MLTKNRRGKFNATRTEVDGILFASKKEAATYLDLKLLEKGGVIKHLEIQKAFPVLINGHKVFTYVADFVYSEGGRLVVQDVKGFRTPMYKLKKRCVEAAYGIKIKET